MKQKYYGKSTSKTLNAKPKNGVKYDAEEKQSASSVSVDINTYKNAQ